MGETERDRLVLLRLCLQCGGKCVGMAVCVCVCVGIRPTALKCVCVCRGKTYLCMLWTTGVPQVCVCAWLRVCQCEKSLLVCVHRCRSAGRGRWERKRGEGAMLETQNHFQKLYNSMWGNIKQKILESVPVKRLVARPYFMRYVKRHIEFSFLVTLNSTQCQAWLWRSCVRK